MIYLVMIVLVLSFLFAISRINPLAKYFIHYKGE
jgi:hypothetical protein